MNRKNEKSAVCISKISHTELFRFRAICRDSHKIVGAWYQTIKAADFGLDYLGDESIILINYELDTLFVSAEAFQHLMTRNMPKLVNKSNTVFANVRSIDISAQVFMTNGRGESLECLRNMCKLKEIIWVTSRGPHNLVWTERDIEERQHGCLF